MSIARALTAKDIYNMKFDTIDISNEFRELLGKDVELNGIWMVYGLSGHGKTSFILRLIKELALHAKVAYNPLEEGARYSFQKAFNRYNMVAVSNVLYLKRESIADLKVRLKRQRSPKVIIIDSLQYTGLRQAGILELQEMFPDKLFIFISHADGKKPKGKVADWLAYHGDVTIWVYQFKAHTIKSRYEGRGTFVIWDEEAEII